MKFTRPLSPAIDRAMRKHLAWTTRSNQSSTTWLRNNLIDVILPGHGYGGMIITGVADRARVRRLVHWNAFVPDNGQNLDDMAAYVRVFGSVLAKLGDGR
jgi:hypothetical protein